MNSSMVYIDSGMDLDPFIFRTSHGTLRRVPTMNAIKSDLDSLIFARRTGMTIETIRFPWNKVLHELGISFNEIEEKREEIIEGVEKNLSRWMKDSKSKIPAESMLSSERLQELQEAVESIFEKKAKDNEIEVSRLAVYLEFSDLEGDADLFKEELRAISKQEPDHYSIGPGGSPKFVRHLKKVKGKWASTDKPRFSRSPKGEGKRPVFQRYSQSVAKIGSKAQFEAAKKELKAEAISEEKFLEFLGKAPSRHVEREEEAS